MTRRISTRGRRRKRKAVLIFILLATTIYLLITVDNRLRPMIKTVAISSATATSTRLINETVTKELSKINIQYNDIVSVDRNNDGTVNSICTNMVELNQFKATISTAIQHAIQNYDQQTIRISTGTLIGGDFFIGRGPRIKIHLDMSGNVTSEIKNNFESAGINQTRHQIMLHVTTKVYAIIPWYSSATTVETNYLLAETVIVGTVPEAFTYVIASDDIPGDINDYGAHNHLQ